MDSPRPKEQKSIHQRKPLTLTKISDEGTGNPIVARLKLGLVEIIQMAKLSEDVKNAIKKCCYDVGTELLLAEKAALPLVQEIGEIEKGFDRDGLRIQQGGVIEVPGLLHLDNARVFLKYAKQALQTLAKGLGLLVGKDFDGPHFHKVRDHVLEKFGKDHVVSKLLVEDQSWIKELLDCRNEDEHPATGKKFVRGFDISLGPDGKYLIDAPRFFNDAPVSTRLEVYSHNLLTFSEEMMAHTLSLFLPPPVQIVEIPEGTRDPKCPVRYKLGLKSSLPP